MLWQGLFESSQLTGRSAARTERVLAIGRAFLTITGLLAIYLDPTEPARLREATYAVLLGYAVYSLGVLAYVNNIPRVTARHTWALHGLDILWCSALTFVSKGPVSPFFLFFLFVVVAAAYRWRFRETVGTAVLVVAVFLIETGLAEAGPWRSTWFASIEPELDRSILRVGYLLLTGALLGYLAEQEKESRGELALIAAASRQPQLKLGLGGSVAAVARVLKETFGAATAVVVIRETETSRVMLWRLDGAPATGRPAVRRFELTGEEKIAWLFPDSGRSWHAVLNGPGGRALIRATEPDAWRLCREERVLPAALLAAGQPPTIAAVNMGLPHEWTARVYLYDLPRRGSIERTLHFMEDLADHITPPLTNVFLQRRLRARAGAAERARVARELHDGAIQSLFGMDMKLEAIRRGISSADLPELDRELADIQQLVRREVLELRELMQALRPPDLDSGAQLPDVIAALVERFRRDTGISARFAAAPGACSMSPEQAIEVVRIVQEALVNIRKHSGARNVLVRLTTDDSDCRLVVEDDGCGLGFEGRLSGRELETRRIGPAIIRERVRALGGTLAIDSTPGAGVRIELSVGRGLA
jgi:signal transduction histidine kinase